MKQKLGLEYSRTCPDSYIISMRLATLQQAYGSVALLASIYRAKNRIFGKFIDVHTINLMEVYGNDAVENTYQAVYGLKAV